MGGERGVLVEGLVGVAEAAGQNCGDAGGVPYGLDDFRDGIGAVFCLSGVAGSYEELECSGVGELVANDGILACGGQVFDQKQEA